MADADTLVERCKQGDKGAFLELYRQHRRDVLRLLTRMQGPHHDVEDLLQEVFLQVHRSLAGFKGQARFSTWLHRLAVNVVLMHRRAARSRPVLEGAEDLSPVVASDPLPDEAASTHRKVRAFYALLDRLSEKKRTVYVLHELEGMTPGEIAGLVGAPVLTVRTRLFYARRDVERLVQENSVLCAADHAAPILLPNRTSKEPV